MSDHEHVYARVPKLAGSWIACAVCAEPYRGPSGIDLINERLALLKVVKDIDPGALMMAADELPLEAVPRSAHLRRIVKALASLNLPDDPRRKVDELNA